MNSIKMKLLDELLSHLDGMQGNDLKSLLDEHNKPPVDESVPEDSEMPDEMKDAMGKPKGIKVESVEIMKPKSKDDVIDEVTKPDGMGSEDTSKAPGEDEMSDEELQELLKKLI